VAGAHEVRINADGVILVASCERAWAPGATARVVIDGEGIITLTDTRS